MEGVEELILLRAGNQLAEGFFTIRREGEALDEADFVFGEGGSREEGETEKRFHGLRVGWMGMMRRASRLKRAFIVKSLSIRAGVVPEPVKKPFETRGGGITIAALTPKDPHG